MAMSGALMVLLFCLILCLQALEQRPPLGRRSKRDFMTSMASFFSNVDKRLAAVEARFDNSTEERLAQLEAKMEGEMQEKLLDVDKKLQGVQDSMKRLETMVVDLISSKLDSKVTEILNSKMTAMEGKVDEMEAKVTGILDSNMKAMEGELTEMEAKVIGMIDSKMKAMEDEMTELVVVKTNATEERLTSLETSNTEALSSPASCRYQYLYRYEKESPRSSGDLQRVVKLESELTRLQEKVSALDKQQQDNNLSSSSFQNASVQAMEGLVHSMMELVATLEQNLQSVMQNTTEIMASMMTNAEVHLLDIAENNTVALNRMEQMTKVLTTLISAVGRKVEQGKSTTQNTIEILASRMTNAEARLLAKAENNAAVFSASIARVEQTTERLTTCTSAVENEVRSVKGQMAALDQSFRSIMQNTTEIIASMMNNSEARLLVKLTRAENNIAVFSTSFARVEQTTKELATQMSTVENKLDNATSFLAKESENTRTKCDVQRQTEDPNNKKTEAGGTEGYRKTCQDYYHHDQRSSGTYKLLLETGQSPMEVYCDMSSGEGWVVFQRRQYMSVDFNRNWTSYEDGFGDLNGDFWLGNRNIHRLTSAGLTRLRVFAQIRNGSTDFLSYSHFSVGDASSSYMLSVSGYSGEPEGRRLLNSSGKKFSTYDRDTSPGNCARSERNGWWFTTCIDTLNLNHDHLQVWRVELRLK